ncbi:MAG TPA: tetratricopeptide repeat protein [Pyrinomonadaceae bacterium]|nr:tetratricopeptide repeat protein [Pyrinomonadaceae bacterium]
MHIQSKSFGSLVKKWSISCVILTASLLGAVAISAQDEGSTAVDNAVAMFNQGQDAHEKGDVAAAIGFYEKALAILPEFPEAEFQLGNAQIAVGKADEAEQSFRKCVKLKPEWSLALAKLGEVLVNKYVEHQHDQTIYKEASEILQRAINIEPGNFPAYVAMTDLLLNSSPSADDLRSMFEKLKALTDGKMNSPASVWAARGELESALGDRPAAKTSLSRALQINPTDGPALYAAANIALSENDTSRATDLIGQLEPITKNRQSLTVLKARLAFANGKPVDALKLLDGITNPSADAIALKNKIAVAGSTNTADLEKQLGTSPKDSAVLGRLCTLYRVSDPAKALDFCRRASEAEPENVSHAIGYGAALVQAKRYDEAISIFQKLLKFEPSNATIHANLATALFQLRRFPQAKDEYHWLVKNQPDTAITYYFLAIVHDQLREYMDAMANYQEFLKLAKPDESKLEIEKVNLRMPALQKLLKEYEKKND